MRPPIISKYFSLIYLYMFMYILQSLHLLNNSQTSDRLQQPRPPCCRYLHILVCAMIQLLLAAALWGEIREFY